MNLDRKLNIILLGEDIKSDTVTVVLYKDLGHRFLIGRRRYEPAKGQWCLPGGHIEPGETPQQAAIRELHEETGIPNNNLHEIHVDRSGKWKDYVFIGKTNYAEYYNHEFSNIKWLPSMSRQELAFNHSNYLKIANSKLSVIY